MSWQRDLNILKHQHRTTMAAEMARERLRAELERLQPDSDRVDAAKAEAVEAAFDKIVSDVGFAAPEMWELTQDKIRTRLQRMADWLISAPWLQDGALKIDDE